MVEKKKGVPPIDRLPQTVKVNGEDVEVWPGYCVYAKRNCSQCRLVGKLLCAPQHRATATLSHEQKAAIAKEARERGVVVVAREKKIPMFIVKGWVGAYARGQKPTSPQAKAVTMTVFAPGECLICGGDLFRDDDWQAHYLDTQSGRIWLCGVCAEGIVKLFKALGIALNVWKEVKDG